jgi:hypothetical protein
MKPQSQEKAAPDNGSVTTHEVRLAFHQGLFQKRKFDEKSREQYECVLLFPPDYDLEPIKKMIADCAAENFGSEAGAKKKIKQPLKACHGEYDGFDEGWHSLRVTNGYPPQVVDQNVQPILDPDGTVIYSGCYVRANLSTYAWKHPTGGRGVSVNVNAVQLLRRGESLTGRKGADELFEPVAGAVDDDEPEGAEPAPAKKGKAVKSVDDLFGDD